MAKHSIIDPEEEDFQEWLNMASHDLGGAKLFLKEGLYPDLGIYHCHQCVEKLLKACLIFNKIPVKRIHDLDKLFSSAIAYVPSLGLYQKDIIALDSYRPRLRYPVGSDLRLDHLESCVYISNTVYNHVINLLKSN